MIFQRYAIHISVHRTPLSAGRDLFCGNTAFTRDCSVLNATFMEIFLVILTEFSDSFGKEHDVVEADRSDSSSCKAKGVDFCSTFRLGLSLSSSFCCSLGLIVDSTGTSFPLTWFVKTKVTWKIQRSNHSFAPTSIR